MTRLRILLKSGNLLSSDCDNLWEWTRGHSLRVLKRWTYVALLLALLNSWITSTIISKRGVRNIELIQWEHNLWWYAKFCGGMARGVRGVSVVFMTSFCYREWERRGREWKEKKCDGSIHRVSSDLETVPANGPINLYYSETYILWVNFFKFSVCFLL
jgi:hypothetical protein